MLLADDARLDLQPLRDPTLVTIAGDWHGEADFASALIERAPAGPTGTRIVVQLGDFSVWPGRAGAAFLDAVADSLLRADASLLFIDGNHEDHPQLLGYPIRADGLRVVRPRLYHLPRGFRWTWHGQRWLALGGAHSIDRPKRTPMVDWWSEEQITDGQAHLAASGGTTDYMVTHDCPAGISMPGICDAEPGQPKELYDELVIEARHRQRLLDVVRRVRPRRLLHGHYHIRYDAVIDFDDGTACAVTGLAKTATMADNAVVLNLLDDELSAPFPRSRDERTAT
ncbi:metallophosphoesterase [Dactylosporangium sp. CA-092794]|uniref:metallophosphoesterase n=1 Tax=Dactylosporangium sp. CA-092794 TaxID=3239929 RepID=UPI003D90CB2C